MLKNKWFTLTLIMTASASMPVISEAPVCHHCEEIRLYNKEHHKNYEYFEDYQNEGSAKKVADGTKEKPKFQKDVADNEKPKL